jgi:cytochrome c oxidase assembly protein subunit 11
MRRANLRVRNAALVTVLLGVAAGMLGLSYASVPLYRLFCQVTGFGGYTHRADAAPAAVPGSVITIRFDANVNGTLPWTFAPEQREVRLALGESGTAVYRAKNLSSQRMIGQATFNVTPFDAAPYFNKIQCFCFQEQPLAPGESAELPVTFFVDPKIADNPNTAGIRTITLSYTFFRATDDEAAAKKVSKTEAKTNTVN